MRQPTGARVRRLLGAMIIAALVAVIVWLLMGRPTPGLSFRSTALTIRQLQLQSRLSVLTVPVTDVQTTEIAGYTGGIRLILQVHGDVELTVDLTQAQLRGVDEARRCATLALPAPTPSRPRLDHQRTCIYQITRTGLWLIVPGQAAEARLVDAAMAEAQRTLEHAAADPGVARQAREQAARILLNAAASLGWTLTVR